MRILVIEDDMDLCEVIQYALTKESYEVDIVGDGESGLELLLKNSYDLVLLDRMLPSMDGATVVRKAREQGVTTPVLMITAMGDVDDRVEGLDAGADDYIVKPLAIKELLARIRAISRRPPSWDRAGVLACGNMELNPATRELRCGEEAIILTRRESALLEMLMKNKGAVLGRDALFTHIWGADAGVSNDNLDNYIRYVRLRLKTVNSPVEIVTVRATGFCLQDKGRRDGN